MSDKRQNLQKEVVDLLCKLIAAESVNPPGKEELAARVLEGYFKEKGLSTTLDYVENERPNISCLVPGKDPNKTILLTSHLDVVPVGDPNSWKSDPFEPRVEDGQVYARGACDAKGSVAAMAVSIANLASIAERSTGNVMFLGVWGEEKGGVGSKWAVKKGLKASAAIVGEPTGLTIAVAQKGRVGIEIELTGRISHPLYPAEGINPILTASKLISFIESYANEVSRKKDSLVGGGSLIINRIQAGAKGVLTPPDKCFLTLSQWFIPNQTHDEVISEIENHLDNFSKENGIIINRSYHKGACPYMISEDEIIVKCLKKGIEAVTGLKPKLTGRPASCDMYVFGLEVIPTIVFGPGNLASAHSVDEYLEIEQLITATRIYSETALDLLRSPN